MANFNNTKWTPAQDAELEQLRADGWAWGKIGERLGRSGKAAAERYYKRHKPVHTPAKAAPEPEPTASVVAAESKPTETVTEPDETADTVASAARGEETRRAELFSIHGDLDLHAEHIATLAGLLRLVCDDAGSGKENYDALMSRLDILLDSLTEATETLDAVAERLGKEILNQPQSGSSTAD